MTLSALPLWIWDNFALWIYPFMGVLVYQVIIKPVWLVLTRLLWRKPSQRRRQRSAKRVLARLEQMDSDAQRFAYLRKIDPFVFEEVVLEAFERRQLKVRRNRRYTGDGGIDGQFWSSKGVRHLIQAKRYSGHINAQHVRDFGLLVEQNRCKGVFVHTGRTGALARSLAQNNPDIAIISGKRLLTLLAPLLKPD